MKFTGERYIPTEQGKIRLEHYHRYAIVLDAVVDKTVLDVACGEGYGAAMMCEVAHKVVGVDIDSEAVQHATHAYAGKGNLSFFQGTAVSLQFPDASFDVVVSFETIEHLAEQAQMLAEIKRVLRPDGYLVISSPNRPIYSEESGEHNEFHVKELDFHEFDELLRTEFPTVGYYGQRMLMGSVVQPLQGRQAAYRAWSDSGDNISPHAGPFSDAVYFLAVCCSQGVACPDLGSSVMYPDRLDLVKHYVGFAKWAQSLDKTVADQREHIARILREKAEAEERGSALASALDKHYFGFAKWVQSLDKIATDQREYTARILREKAEVEERGNALALALDEQDSRIAALNQEVANKAEEIRILTEKIVNLNKWASDLDTQLDEARSLSRAMAQTYSWKVTFPLREARRWSTMPRQQARRYLGFFLRSAKNAYQTLPLSQETKLSHRAVLAKLMPRVLLLSGSNPSSILESALPVARRSEEVRGGNGNAPWIEQSIELATSSTPVVSVVIPIYGKIDYTMRCLASIADQAPQVSFEVIVVDDCSPDDSVKQLEKWVRGIRLIRNSENQGFIRSCNAGAKAARGEYLCFLNNDTEITSGWLEELLATFDAFPGAGLAGSKLVYPDGRLQEAGGIIWQDGSAWNFGRLQNPLLPVYNYAREVDYCSGASIMLPRSLFLELNGFDEYYLPAYCEDSDLALKIRDKGYRVIYQPLSQVIHYEGVTSGTDTSQGAKAYQVENGKKLFGRWRDRLSRHQTPGADVDDAKDRMAKRRVLVLDHCTPTPDQDAGSVSLFNIMMLLREMDFQVTFIPEDNFLYMANHTTLLQRAGIEVLYSPYVLSVEQHLKEAGNRYDLVFLFRPVVVERHIKSVKRYCPAAPVLYYPHDLHYLRMMREADLLDDMKKRQAASEMKVREFATIKAVDATVVVSATELELLRSELPDQKILVLPLILDMPGTNRKFPERRDIVFVGGYQHTPNVDAVKYFVTEVMPILRARLRGVRFHAVGSNPPEDIRKLATEDVIITGYVQDLNSLLDTMRVSVAPLRYGAGIKGKIGSAMAVGLPIVATSVAAEGMMLTSGKEILVADSAEEFAAAVVSLYEDESLWNRLSEAGWDFAVQAWGAEAAWKRLAEILVEVGIVSQRGSNKLWLYKPRPYC